MGDPGFLRRFARASRPGAYLRIVREGELGAGDAIRVADRPDHPVTVRLMSDAILLDHALLPSLLEAPGLIDEWRAWIAERTAA
jgi:MOSC domain-containing protein YiiM